MSTVNPPDDPFETAVFLGEELPEETMTDLERRRLLELTGQMGAAIALDLQDRGPLYRYVQSRRKVAKEYLLDLVKLDPRDAVGIAQAQTAVKEYLEAITWIHDWNQKAEQAETIINEEYGDGAKAQ